MELLRVEEVAKICKVSRAQVYDFFQRGLPYVPVGKRGRRVSPAALQNWIAQQETTTGSASTSSHK